MDLRVDVETEIVIGRPGENRCVVCVGQSNAPDWYANIESMGWGTSQPATRLRGHGAHTGAAGAVLVRALGAAARCVPVMSDDGGHSWFVTVKRISR